MEICLICVSFYFYCYSDFIVFFGNIVEIVDFCIVIFVWLFNEIMMKFLLLVILVILFIKLFCVSILLFFVIVFIRVLCFFICLV